MQLLVHTSVKLSDRCIGFAVHTGVLQGPGEPNLLTTLIAGILSFLRFCPGREPSPSLYEHALPSSEIGGGP